MGVDQPRWYQIGKRAPRVDNVRGRADQGQSTNGSQTAGPTPLAHTRSAANSDGALVARSQIILSGTTATLAGTMTNETSCDVHFVGTPPYARTLDTDGSRPVLLGDFNSPPRERPSSGDWVIHPGASVPYRSLPVTLKNPDPRWDGADWCASSQSTTLDAMTFRSERRLLTIQIIS